jgi:predicted MFS family arabinose efflux permease
MEGILSEGKENPAAPVVINERMILFVLAAIQFVHVLDFVIMMPLGPAFKEAFDLSPKEFALLVSSYTISASIFGLFGSFFIDKFDRKHALLVLFLGFSVGTFFCAISRSYITLLLSRIFAGAFGGIMGALIFAIVGDVTAPERRGRAMGLIMSSFSVASIFGVPLGLAIANKYAWHTPFYFLSGLCAIILVLSFYFLPNIRIHLLNKTVTKTFDLIIGIGKSTSQMYALSLTVMLQIAGFVIIPFVAQFMVSNVGIRNEDLFYIYLIGGSFTFFTNRLVGYLADKFGKPQVFIIAAFLSLIPIYLVTNLPRVELWTALAVTTIFFIFSSARFVPAMAIVTSTVPPQNRGGFMSINSFFQNMASGLAALLAGLMVTEGSNKELVGFNYAGWLSVAVTIVCVLIVRRIRTRF